MKEIAYQIALLLTVTGIPFLVAYVFSRYASVQDSKVAMGVALGLAAKNAADWIEAGGEPEPEQVPTMLYHSGGFFRLPTSPAKDGHEICRTYQPAQIGSRDYDGHKGPEYPFIQGPEIWVLCACWLCARTRLSHCSVCGQPWQATKC